MSGRGLAVDEYGQEAENADDANRSHLDDEYK